MLTELARAATEALDPCPHVANDRLRHRLIGSSRVPKADDLRGICLAPPGPKRGRSLGVHIDNGSRLAATLEGNSQATR